MLQALPSTVCNGLSPVFSLPVPFHLPSPFPRFDPLAPTSGGTWPSTHSARKSCSRNSPLSPEAAMHTWAATDCPYPRGFWAGGRARGEGLEINTDTKFSQWRPHFTGAWTAGARMGKPGIILFGEGMGGHRETPSEMWGFLGVGFLDNPSYFQLRL